MDQIDTSAGVVSGSVGLTVLGGSTIYFRTGSNNTWLASGNNRLVSGSNNTFIGNPANAGVQFQTGSGNLIIGNFNGSLFPNTEYNNLLSIGMSSYPSLINKNNTAPLKINSTVQITGSFSSSTGFYDIKDIATASLNLSTANVWYIDDDDTPDGAHLEVSNITDGQQISIIWNANYTGTRTITLGSNIEKTGATTGSFSLEGAKKYQIMGSVYGGKLYITPLL